MQQGSTVPRCSTSNADGGCTDSNFNVTIGPGLSLSGWAAIDCPPRAIVTGPSGLLESFPLTRELLRPEKGYASMPLTKDFKETVRDRAHRDRRFREALLTEALHCFLSDDVETGKA